MKPHLLALLGTLAAGAAPAQAPGQRADFVTTLGRDTVLDKPITFGDLPIPAGRYSLWTLPTAVRVGSTR